MKKHITLIRSCASGHSITYIGAVLCMALAVCSGFVTPLLLGETLDAVLSQSRALNLPGVLGEWVSRMGGRAFLISHLWIIALCLVFVQLLGGLFGYLRGRLAAIASESIAENLRNRLYEHLGKVPYQYHVGAKTGDLIQRLTSDVETVRKFLSSQIVDVFRTLLMLCISASLMLSIHVPLALWSMSLLPALFLLGFLFFHWVRRAFQQVDEAEGRMSCVLQENMAGVRVVRAFGRGQYEVEKFLAANGEHHGAGRKLSDIMMLFWPAGDMISLMQGLVTLIAGIHFASKGEITVGEITVFISYVAMLMWPVRQLGRILTDMGKAVVALTRMEQILDEPVEPIQADAVKPPLNRDIVFEHVGFSYDGKTPVLKDVSFTVRAGQTVAILGATGSGKSTMMHLMQRLYAPETGRITIGGIDIGCIDRQYLRTRVGLILQEPFLYARTVKENIAFVASGATEQDIVEAAKIACADDFIHGFESGYETIVGERGVTLSGGQKQRVAIARTLLKQSDILIFDDSLSAVDTETDAWIRAALKSRIKPVTTFIISHRLTTLAGADLIIVLEHGRIAQQGIHDELIQTPGLYRSIYQIQRALEEEME